MGQELNAPVGYAVFEPVLSRWDTERLAQAAEAVATLHDHPGYQILFQVLGEKREREMAKLIHGGVLPHQNYAAIAGTLSGLDQVLHVAEAVQHAHERALAEERVEAEATARREEAA